MLGLALSLLIVEAGSWWFAAGPKPVYVWPPRLAHVFHPSPVAMPGVVGPSRFTINSSGIRGRELPADERAEYRLLAVGGSTTECLYLDDEKAWPFRLEQILGKTADGRTVWVGNVGKAGVNARDHVLHVKYLLPQYPRMDGILLLIGINDLTVRLAEDGDYTPLPPLSNRDAEARQFVRAFARGAPTSLANGVRDDAEGGSVPWYQRTATYQVLTQMRTTFRRQMAARGQSQDDMGRVLDVWRGNRRAATAIIDRVPDLTSALAEYRRNLNAIIDLAHQRRSRVVLMTQPVLWRADLGPHEKTRLWLGGVGNFQEESGKPYYSVQVLAEAMFLYNQELLRVCAERGIDCIDLASRIPRTTEMFYDDAHFTERGAELVARIVADHFATKPPFVPSRSPS